MNLPACTNSCLTKTLKNKYGSAVFYLETFAGTAHWHWNGWTAVFSIFRYSGKNSIQNVYTDINIYDVLSGKPAIETLNTDVFVTSDQELAELITKMHEKAQVILKVFAV